MAKKTESLPDAALARIRTICHRFAGVEEKLSHGMPSFHVRGKMFVNFVDDHHDDGRLAVWLKASFERQREFVAAHPDRYFVPPYVGVRGWLGARLDRSETDWVELAILIEEGWLAIAPPKLARGEGGPAKPPPPPPPRPTTDARVARDGFQRLSKICLAFPEAVCEREGGKHATFRVAKKIFVWFLDNHHGDAMVIAGVRGDVAGNAKLVKKEPTKYASPAYIGPRGWLGLRLETGKVPWDEVERRVGESYLSVAPKRLIAKK